MNPFKPLLRRKTIGQIHEDLQQAGEAGGHQLKKSLGIFDLVCFGIAAIIGAGIFSTIGNASADGGPAVSLLFILTAIACLFSALCYAEFASTIPISGSAYTYSYVAFGELIAWIIGWNLLMEYAIGNSTVAFSWSAYFCNLLDGFSLHIPDWLQTDYYSCAMAAKEMATTIANKTDPSTLPQATIDLYNIWQQAPKIGELRLLLDVPALLLNVLITALVYVGIQESKLASNLMVILKVGVVLMVIAIGAFYVKPENWSPFAPNGATGVLKGIAAVFFAFIGFDAISTTAEECKNPQRDLPKATVLTLIICTILYVTIAMVLTGMVSYKQLAQSDPLAYVFEQVGLDWVAFVVSISAVFAITSVFLVFQLGQPRIWMSMARDGLLPQAFARIHPRFKTPSFSTVMTGIVVAIPTIFLNQAVVTDLCSIGTLFAFMLVSAGIIALENDRHRVAHAKFRVPYINGRYVVPVLCLFYIGLTRYMPANHYPLSQGILGRKSFRISPSSWSSWCWRFNLSDIAGP